MTGIQYITGLEELDCTGNQLTTLDVRGCEKLTTLDCSNNQLTSLNLDSNTALQDVHCGEQSRSMELERREDGTEDLGFRSNAAFADFLKVQVDGNDLDPACYTAQEDSTIITLMKEYLKTLNTGVHTLSIVSTTGTESTNFMIQAVQTVSSSAAAAAPSDDTTYYTCAACGYVESTKRLSSYSYVKGTYTPGSGSAAVSGTIPQTGDESNPALWAILLVISGLALGGIVCVKRKDR